MLHALKFRKIFWAKQNANLHDAENHYKPHNYVDTLTVAQLTNKYLALYEIWKIPANVKAGYSRICSYGWALKG